MFRICHVDTAAVDIIFLLILAVLYVLTHALVLGLDRLGRSP